MTSRRPRRLGRRIEADERIRQSRHWIHGLVVRQQPMIDEAKADKAEAVRKQRGLAHQIIVKAVLTEGWEVVSRKEHGE